MKNYSFRNNFVLFTMFLTFVFAGMAFAIEPSAQNPQVLPVGQQVAAPAQNFAPSQVQPETIPEKNAYALSHMEKDGFKYGILKFILAMAGVLVSSLAIWGGLKIYQKFVLNKVSIQHKVSSSTTLETPKDFKDALNLFLDKTDK